MSVMVKEVPIHGPSTCHHERLQLSQSEEWEAWMGVGKEVLFRIARKKTR